MTNPQLIQQLKQQPRMGMPTGINVDLLKKLDGLIDKLGDSAVVAINQGISKALQEAGESAAFFETRISALNKGMGITSAAANKLNSTFVGPDSLGESLNKDIPRGFKISNLEMQKYAINMQKMLPTLKQVNLGNNKHYKGMMQVQNIMKQSVGLSNELTNSYTQYAAQMKGNAAQQLKFTKAFTDMIDPDGTMGAFTQITTEIAEAGSEIQIQYGRLPGKLEQSVMKAKKFGFSIKDVAKMGDTLLNIESSIGDELEYQLLSGRRLVNDQGESLTNKMREAALQGDMNKQAETLNEIVMQEGDHLKNNMFARKQLAKTLGIEESKLASALQKKMILEKAGEAGISLSLDSTDDAFDKAAAELTKTGAMTSKEFGEFKKQMDTRTTEDLLKESLLVQRESLMVNLMAIKDQDGLTSIDGLRSDVLSLVGAMETMGVDPTSTIGSGMGKIMGGKGVLKLSADIANAFADTENMVAGLQALFNGEFGTAAANFLGDTTNYTGATTETAVTTPAGGGAYMGGPVSAGTSYMVGEQGPEMFIPSTPGSIVSNGSTANGTALKTDNRDVVAAINNLSQAILNQPATSFNGNRG